MRDTIVETRPDDMNRLIRPERKLLGGASFLDKEGSERTEARLRWWKPAPTTLGEALLFRGAPKGLELDTP